MEEVVLNALMHDGMRRMKVIGDETLTLPSPKWERVVPVVAQDKLQVVDAQDAALGIFSMELSWPVFEAWEVANYGPRKFRRLMMVNYTYAERVSDCIELARVAFFAGTHFAPGYAFVREIPKGAEDGMDVHGLILLEADWMPERCVAVGGRG